LRSHQTSLCPLARAERAQSAPHLIKSVRATSAPRGALRKEVLSLIATHQEFLCVPWEGSTCPRHCPTPGRPGRPHPTQTHPDPQHTCITCTFRDISGQRTPECRPHQPDAENTTLLISYRPSDTEKTAIRQAVPTLWRGLPTPPPSAPLAKQPNFFLRPIPEGRSLNWQVYNNADLSGWQRNSWSGYNTGTHPVQRGLQGKEGEVH